MAVFYLDTCIWRDFYENRTDPKGRALGKSATIFLLGVMKEKDVVLYSDIIIDELKAKYEYAEIAALLATASRLMRLKKVEIREEDYREAVRLSLDRKLPVGDALHAVVARNNHAILVTQDKHFRKLHDIVAVRRPEES
ncbi:MAG: PIN domain-containing protein [Nanoarchaeota archaeon]